MVKQHTTSEENEQNVDAREVLKNLTPREAPPSAEDAGDAPDDASDEERHEDTAPQSDAQKAMQALSDDDDEHVNWSVGAVLGGEIFSTSWIRHQAGFFVLIVIMLFVYISNRYSAQKELIKIEKLKVELNEVRNEATTRSSQLLQRSRESKVAEYLKNTPDSLLDIPMQAPYIIIDDGK